MTQTCATHWIATTFGSWLHGDPRGSWRDGRFTGPDPFVEEAIRARMTADTVVLSEVEMGLVAAAFGQIVRERQLPVLAATVHPTHVHLVFARTNDPMKTVIAALKYRSARTVWNLRRTMCRPVGRSLWTEGQFHVFIFDERHLFHAVEYVREHNRRIGRDDDPYPWIGEFPAGRRKRSESSGDGSSFV